ncbi:MAG: pyroglutamyl-peptidase I [Firmicutes bacterium]|nr:pyroglutamyl-peptidase I [Bacillota bacterium]
MPRILITGFEPFGGATVNPASLAVQKLENMTRDNVQVITREIPTVFDKSPKAVQDAISELSPDAVISVGQAGGTPGIRVERVALNLSDARIPDNEGNCPSDSLIVPAGPVAYWATIPARELVDAITKQGIPAFISYSAGTFVCNHVFYSTCHFVAVENMPIKVGFIHVPYLPCQAVGKGQAPSMSLECIVTALETAVEVVAGSIVSD